MKMTRVRMKKENLQDDQKKFSAIGFAIEDQDKIIEATNVTEKVTYVPLKFQEYQRFS